jgi:hypothetical protein
VTFVCGRYVWPLSVAIICGYLWTLSVVERELNAGFSASKEGGQINTSVPCLRICGIGLHHYVCERCLVTITSCCL